jgi:hypothetical protein
MGVKHYRGYARLVRALRIERLILKVNPNYDQVNLQISPITYCFLEVENSKLPGLEKLSEKITYCFLEVENSTLLDSKRPSDKEFIEKGSLGNIFSIESEQNIITIATKENSLFVVEIRVVQNFSGVEKLEKDNFFYKNYIQYLNSFYENNILGIRNQFLKEGREFEQYWELFCEIDSFDPVSKYTLIPLYVTRNRMSSQLVKLASIHPSPPRIVEHEVYVVNLMSNIKNSEQEYYGSIDGFENMLSEHMRDTHERVGNFLSHFIKAIKYE